jgi:hypothetical protein
VLGALGVLAAPVVDEETVTPGPLGFAVVLFLAIATWLLVRSMNHHLRKVPRDVPRDPGDEARRGDARPADPHQPDPRQPDPGQPSPRQDEER